MLQPTAEALAFLHKAGFVHGGIKPSNIMAVKDELKISADGLRQTGERPTTHPSSAYDPPEFKIAGPSPAADIWSLGATLLAVLTQNEPQLGAGEPRPASVPATVPPTLREITRQCLQPEPRQRGTVSHILSQLNPPAIAEKTVASAMAERARPPAAQKRWMAVSVIAAALILAALLGFKFLAHQPEVPAAEPRATTTLAETLPAQAPAPFSENKKSAAKGVVRGRVVHQVLPEVSRSAQSTITGRLTVSVRVEVDSEGNVSLAKLASPGPSQYFATRALAAAGRWKFAAPQLDGQAVASTWILRFQFGHKSNQVFPAELKP
jgi:TonB family protein